MSQRQDKQGSEVHLRGFYSADGSKRSQSSQTSLERNRYSRMDELKKQKFRIEQSLSHAHCRLTEEMQNIEFHSKRSNYAFALKCKQIAEQSTNRWRQIIFRQLSQLKEIEEELKAMQEQQWQKNLSLNERYILIPLKNKIR